MKTMRTDAHLSGASKKLRQLVAHIETERTNIRIASFTAKEAQEIRVTMLRQLGEVLEELFKVRDAKQLATEGQMHVYRALAALMRVRELLLLNAGLDEIQGIVEMADAELSQVQSPEKSSSRGRGT